MRRLVKAEILWTRKCPLKCSYCGMVDYPFEKAPTEQMCEGVRRLAKLGCEFAAIYGSSPLWSCEFEGLPEFVRECGRQGVLTTVIADGVDKQSKEKVALLYEAGLRSLTCSLDADPSQKEHFADKATQVKAGKGLELIRWWKKTFYEEPIDAQLTATVTRRNWRALLGAVPMLSKEGIWFSFDFVHPDRGQPGTKCKGTAEGLRFESTMEDMLAVSQFASELWKLKEEGALIHQSSEYLRALFEQPGLVTSLKWMCNRGKAFPAWVTVDADGSVLPCDDFWTDRSLKVWDLEEVTLEAFGRLYRKEVETKCPGCIWSTHWDAVQIVDGGDGFEHYAHMEARQ
mgnify:CR=1 FL=1